MLLDLNFLSNREQVIKIGNLFSRSMTLNTGAPQGCVLSPWLYRLYTNDCVSPSDSVTFSKYADDTTVVGLIKNVDELAYRAEVDSLVIWYKGNDLLLNISKTMEMIIDFRRGKEVHPPPFINGKVERISSYKFLGTTICDDLKWEANTSHIISEAHQRLHSLCQLRKFGVSREGMLSFYRNTVETVLTFSLTVWYGNTTVQNREQLERVVCTASKIVVCDLPSIAPIHATRIRRKGEKVTGDPSHPAHSLFNPLPSGR